MRKSFRLLLLSAVILLFSNSSFAQNKITKYCVVTGYTINLLGSRVRIHYGKVDSLFSFKDSSIKRNLQKVTSFKTLPDALNYMGIIGWTLVGMVNDESRNFIRFYFKKDFDREELGDE